MNTKFILPFIAIILFVIAGCSSELPDCSEQDTKYVNYSYDENEEKCVVSNKLDKDVCGNGIKEEGETYCGCPEDVRKDAPIEEGGCSGDKGEFLSYQCSQENSCELKVTEKVKENSKLLEFRQGGDFSFDAEVFYNTPFMVDRHEVKLEIMLKDILNNENVKVKDLKIVKAYIVTQDDELLGSKTIDTGYSSKFETHEFSVPVDKFSFETFNKELRNVFLRLLITYKKETYNDDELYRTDNEDSQVQDIFENNFKLINPENKNEEVETTSGGWS